MNEQNLRYILWVVFFFLVVVLFNAWENEKVLTDQNKSGEEQTHLFDIVDKSSKYKIDEKLLKYITVSTDLIYAKIDVFSGDIIYLSLKKYSESLENTENGFVIFNKSDDKVNLAKSGFCDKDFFKSSSLDNYFYSTNNVDYEIITSDLNLFVLLKSEISDGVFITKVYTFRNYSYEIDVDFYIKNNTKSIYSGRLYGLIKQKKEALKASIFGSSMRIYEGGVLYTPEKSYKKIPLNDVFNKPFFCNTNGGWIAMLEGYFLSGWFPSFSYNYVYTVEKSYDNFYVLKYINEKEIIILPGECKRLESVLFVGPKVKGYLNSLYKGIDLAIDYGVFWPISSPIFLLLSKIYKLVENWGVSIILVTLMIKLLFFHLSSISYRAMNLMKHLQPRLNLLKEQYKDDKKLFGQAVMDLYKKEKINPLSGCLPLLIQIPVFISLFYVLLESVELRHASFCLWINDLSSKDSYYILPIIMCLTLFVQQKLNPPIQDPLQAKIMMFMPLVFLVIFLQFPSGLMLYWIVNNILSILQQFVIIKTSSV